MSVKVFQYPKCSTCRKALKWFAANGIEVESIDIVSAPPSKTALKRFHKASELPIRKFFNTSGQSYRNGGFKAKLETMTQAEAYEALAADGKLIKRPLVVADDVVLVGFKEETYAAAFKK